MSTPVCSGFKTPTPWATRGPAAAPRWPTTPAWEVEGGITVAEPISLTGGGYPPATSWYGALRSTGGDNTWSGEITVTGFTRIGVRSANTFTITGGIVGTGSPAFVGVGNSMIRIADNPIDVGSTVYVLDNSVVLLDVAGNSWGNTEIRYGGTLKLGLDDAMPATTVVNIGTTNDTNGTLDLNGHSQAVAGLQDQGAGTRRVVNSGSGTPILTVNNSTDYTFAGTLGATGMDGFGLTKTGAGKLTLGGTNTLDGPITVGEGVLEYSAATNLGSGTIVLDGGTLRSIGDTPDVLAVNNPILLTADSVFDANHASYTAYYGVIDDGAGTFGFERIGGNHFRLHATNTYDGQTILTQGITYAYADGAFGSTVGATTVGSSAQLAVQVNYTIPETVYLNGGTMRTRVHLRCLPLGGRRRARRPEQYPRQERDGHAGHQRHHQRDVRTKRGRRRRVGHRPFRRRPTLTPATPGSSWGRSCSTTPWPCRIPHSIWLPEIAACSGLAPPTAYTRSVA